MSIEWSWYLGRERERESRHCSHPVEFWLLSKYAQQQPVPIMRQCHLLAAIVWLWSPGKGNFCSCLSICHWAPIDTFLPNMLVEISTCALINHRLLSLSFYHSNRILWQFVVSPIWRIPSVCAHVMISNDGQTEETSFSNWLLPLMIMVGWDCAQLFPTFFSPAYGERRIETETSKIISSISITE